jgi:galactokinase
MSADEAAKKAAIFTELSREMREMADGKCDRSCSFFVPGRVELVGKHTDYAGGRSLVCAVERGFCLTAAPREDAHILMRDRQGRSTEFTFDPDAEPAPRDWSNYGITVARRIARDFPAARTGANIVFASDLPPASGMSSSSALIIAVFSALAEINVLPQTAFFGQFIQNREDLAGYLGAVECGAAFGASSGDRGVGTLGGSEDHVAILCTRAGFARQYSYCPIHFEREVRLPEDYSLVIAVSGVEADKTGKALDAYNRASLVARVILERWRSKTGRDDASLAAALSSAPDAAERMREILRMSADRNFSSSRLVNRFEQFAEESNRIVPAVSEALAKSDLERVGVLMDRSQYLAETCLGNQTPETIELVRSAGAHRAVAASAFGAGFGGSVWALVASSDADNFRRRWAADYRQRFPERAERSAFLITRAGPGLVAFQAAQGID